LTKGLDSIRRKVLAHREDIAGELAYTAEVEGSQVVVLTSHDWDGLRRTLGGSVAEELARVAPCPVLIIGPQTEVVKDAKKQLRLI